ncbi:hypothetical protein GDO78_019169 [Eleutherodactylus coqui]|uniref:Uncharacterized protein n=1 Tax=Eleutherodactylus coqui TaxID=57060 RepID=A0A8J6AZ72_ELECQ|nr:hypothetical protein GDO78_019169 [Eleutherodactylus coqui]
MAESWRSEEVQRSAAEGFVAIRIDSKSETCLQFSQICILPVRHVVTQERRE